MQLPGIVLVCGDSHTSSKRYSYSGGTSMLTQVSSPWCFWLHVFVLLDVANYGHVKSARDGERLAQTNVREFELDVICVDSVILVRERYLDVQTLAIVDRH